MCKDKANNESKTGTEARRKDGQGFGAASTRVELIRGVTAERVRKELVGRGVQPEETILWRQRVTPRSLHLVWIGERLNGREVVYVEGANNGKMLVRLDGLRGRLMPLLKLAPDSPTARWSSRYPVNVVGYDALVKRIVENYDKARQRGSLNVVDFGLQVLSGRQTHAFSVVLDYPEAQSGDYHKMMVWFDLRSGLPVRFVGLDRRGCLLEDYHWQKLRINQGLTDADFVIGSTRPKPKPEPEPKPTRAPEPTPEAKPKPASQPEAPKVTDSSPGGASPRGPSREVETK